MIRRVLLWLTARLPVKVIGRDEPYVEWYHVATVLGLFRVQLHRFVRSDPDGLHDHPWSWSRSFVVSGWYLEERRDRTRVRGAGTTYGMTGDTFHRVVLPHGGEVWTLFIHGPYVKKWGFLQPRVRRATETSSPTLPDWYDSQAAVYTYIARERSEHRFDPWPWEPDAPRGRDIREALAA